MNKRLAILGFICAVIACGVWLWTSFPAPLPTIPHARRAVPTDGAAAVDATAVLPSTR